MFALDLRGVDGDRRRAAVHAEQLLRDQAPIAALLATLCLIVARSRPQPTDPAEDQQRREP